MGHPLHRHQRHRLRGVMSVVVAVVLIGATAAAGLHSHAETAESPVACSVCASTHHAPVAAAPVAIAQRPTAILTPSTPEPGFDNRPAVESTERTRAPPA